MERQFFKITRWARAARFWLLLLGALLAWIGCTGEARAGLCGMYTKLEAGLAAGSGLAYQYEGQARAACEAAPNFYVPAGGQLHTRTKNGACEATGTGGKSFIARYIQTNKRYNDQTCDETSVTGSTTDSISGWTWATPGCPPGETLQPDGTCSDECANAPPILNAAVRGSLSACHNGCSYDPDPDMLNACLTVGHEQGNSIAPDYCKTTRWRANGQTCGADNTEPNDPDKPTCISTGGGFSHCVMEDGKQCVIGASGRRYCWKSGETGPRVSSDGTEGAALTPEGAPITPPPNMQNPTQTGDGATVTTGGGGGGTAINNSTNFTGTGNSGGQGDVGEGGSDRPGGGFGTGSGNGDGDEIDWGEPGDTGGDLYTPSEETVAGVFGTFKDRVTASPLLTAADAFFTAPTSGPGCPTWVIPASEWSEAMVFDFFCNPALAVYLTYAGYILLAVAAMYAFHIAIGD